MPWEKINHQSYLNVSQTVEIVRQIHTGTQIHIQKITILYGQKTIILQLFYTVIDFSSDYYHFLKPHEN